MATNFQVVIMARNRNFWLAAATPQDVKGHPIFLRYSNPELGIKFRLTEFAVLLPFEP